MTGEKKEIFLKDYTPPAYLVDQVHLTFELQPTGTRVHSVLHCQPNTDSKQPLVLNGEHLELIEVKLEDVSLSAQEYSFSEGLLTIPDVPDAPFTLEITTLIDPQENTALEGLYLSSGNYCTQCEAEGFRRITCFPDRPDVMAVFTTTIIADKSACPVLLSNGNLLDSGELENGKHFATWHDPHKKPSYLFALVAGDLVCIQDTFITASGREVDLRIYVEDRNKDKCGHAMASLKKAMQWDEEVYGREYDLDIYMIVAVDDFNMGAMENKGLNVFNSKYVLATPESATDADFDGIEGVIGHEYFHNWTGNRVTCRDWFQLSLKEGLTVFRDQEFSSDMGSRAVKRIQDVNVIRSFQFREDAGPMAHPIRPASFVEINNFYTLTVYNKGAEVIRMMHTFLGADGFRKGMDLYFERHDGQAVTCDDFVQAMADANGVDFSLFKRWYSQAGTPVLDVETSFNALQETYTVQVTQSCRDTPETEVKKPFTMPLSMGLVGDDGPMTDVQTADGQLPDKQGTFTLPLSKEKQQFIFSGVRKKPVLSFLRNFSAPVRVNYKRPAQELSCLMARDSDPFNRWNAAQELQLHNILDQINTFTAEEALQVDQVLMEGVEALLEDENSDPALIAAALILPSENWIAQQLEVVDPVRVFTVRNGIRRRIAEQLSQLLIKRYRSLQNNEGYAYTQEQVGARALKNCCLAYLLTMPDHVSLGIEQYEGSDNMTDTIAALQAVVNLDQQQGDHLLQDFYNKWQHDPLVMDKWLIIQAGTILPGTLTRVKQLMNHSVFSLKNPNKVRALIGSFCSGNHAQFHAEDGSGYQFLTDVLFSLDPLNPQVASRMATPLTQWQRYDQKRQVAMKKQLERLACHATLSDDLHEIVNRALNG